MLCSKMWRSLRDQHFLKSDADMVESAAAFTAQKILFVIFQALNVFFDISI